MKIPDPSYSNNEYTGQGTYPSTQKPGDDDKLVPFNLMTDPGFYAQARNCAIQYNDAQDLASECIWADGLLKAVGASAAAAVALSSGVASLVPNAETRPEQADKKRAWQGAALVSTAIFAAATSTDLIINCSATAEAQTHLAAERLTYLTNASYALDCSTRANQAHDKFVALKSKVQASVDKQEATLRADPKAKQSPELAKLQKLLTSEPTDMTQILAAADELAKANPEDPAAKDTNSKAQQWAALTGLTCEDKRTVSEANKDKTSGRTLADYFRDQVNVNLAACNNVRFSGLGQAQGSTQTNP